MGIYFGGQEYAKAYAAGQEVSKGYAPGGEFHAPAPASHTFTITAGSPFGQAAWRGWKQADSRSVEQGSIDSTAFVSPDGVSRNLQFFIAMTTTSGRIEITDLSPAMQFPDRITIARGDDSQVWGNMTSYADRFGAQADYSRVSGAANVLLILSTSEQSTITFHWD